MGIQDKADREKFSRLRQSLLRLADEIQGLVEPFFSDRPVIKGTVYELKRRCGKSGCKCARGELHALVECMHGAGSPQAQRIAIYRQANLAEKMELAKRLAGIADEPDRLASSSIAAGAKRDA